MDKIIYYFYNTFMKKYLYWLLVIAILAVLWVIAEFAKEHLPKPAPQPPQDATSQPPTEVQTFAEPISNALSRITKKPFGIYITQATSPVQPERFSGYHTGTDFETTPEEANLAVPFYAICDGKIVAKRTATGYGGVFVQSCTINNQSVTIIYGHVSLSSISKNIGDNLSKGEMIGNLGSSPSETDGERKHLHLGIHLGTSISILGYVQIQSDLANWLDWQKLK